MGYSASLFCFCSAQWMVGKVALYFSQRMDIVPQSASSIAKVKVVLSLVCPYIYLYVLG